MKTRITFEDGQATFIAEPENEWEVQMLRMLGCESAPLHAEVDGRLESWRNPKDVRLVLRKSPAITEAALGAQIFGNQAID